MRQLADSDGAITLARTYDPYGVVTAASGPSASGYGFTGEYQSGDSVYLRSRFYAPSTGRFLTRDTWSGNANRPLSFNRWGYVEGNPVNFVDPTGMSPECDIIQGSFGGRSHLQCEKIIRDIDPNNDWALNKVYTYDLFSIPENSSGDDCLPDLFFKLAIPFSYKDANVSETYGFWFHFLLNNTPGWWNKNGMKSTDFTTVAALAVSNELGHAEGLRNDIMGMALEAFVRKGWTEGFYRMIGSRQIVREVVDAAIMLPRTDGQSASYTRLLKRNAKTGDYSFEQARAVFASRANGFNMNGGLTGQMYYALANSAYHNDGGGQSPYEWGNPPENMNQKLRDALSYGARTGSDITQVYYKNVDLTNKQGNIQVGTIQFSGKLYYNLFFVTTKNQIKELCGGVSCVQP